MIRQIKYPERKIWADLLKRPVQDQTDLEDQVAEILKNVKNNGDFALAQYSKMFDGVQQKSFKVDHELLNDKGRLLSSQLKNAIQTALENITTFHKAQIPDEVPPVETMPGVLCWQRSVPIDNIGLYIPGGSAPLFSTVLMLAVPAKLAGCPKIVLCSPPGENGLPHPTILYCAGLCGVTEIFSIGGAQAIGAMAYGTEQVPRVDKIFGPGNSYVTMAKQLVQKDGIAIDLPAGPSEVLVFADHTANPEFVAADLLSQAEHGPDSQVILVTTEPDCLDKVVQAARAMIESLPRRDIAKKALGHARAILLRETEVTDLINMYGPEHLILASDSAEDLAGKMINAGSVFIGHYTPEAAGDYASGTNHTLPTNGFARAYSGVSVDSFLKKITYQKITREGLKNLGPVVEEMAKEENLVGHQRAIAIRNKERND